MPEAPLAPDDGPQSAPRSRWRWAAGVGAAVLVLVLPACEWAMAGYSPDRTGFNETETEVGVANVASLSAKWRGVTGGVVDSSPAVSHGVAYVGSRDGNLYAVDASFNNVQIFNREGRLLLFFSGPGFEAGQLQLPADVAIDYDNVGHFREFAGPDFEIEYLVLVTSQFGPRQVNIFGFGRDRNRKYPTEAEIREQIEQRRKKEMERQQPPPP